METSRSLRFLRVLCVKLLLCLSAFYVHTNAQVPFPCTNLRGVHYSTGTHLLENGTCILSPGVPIPTIFDQDARVDYKAGERILLTDKFKAGNFSANGYFKASIVEPVMEAMIFSPGGDVVPKYDRFEVGIKLPSGIQAQIDAFLAGNPGLNPYDPDQLKLEATFTAMVLGGTYVRYGFYYQDVSQSGTGWTVTNSTHPFRIRFAPPKADLWRVNIRLFVNNVHIGNDFIGLFTVDPSNKKGHLEVGAFGYTLKHEDGSSFFAIGKNVAWAQNGLSDGTYNGYGTSIPTEFNAQRNTIINMASYGGNFARIRMDPWSNAIEWETSQCGNYHNRQNHAWELDQTLGTCEANNVYILLCLENDQALSPWNHEDTSDFKLYYSWGAVNQGFHPNNTAALNPYYHLLGGPSVNPSPTLFLTNPNARKYFKQRLFYIVARWGYSPNIGMWELMNETDNFGWTNENFREYDLVSVQQNMEEWHCEMSSYLDNFYPDHLVKTGFTGSGPKSNDQTANCPFIDVVGVNSYMDTLQMNYDHRYATYINIFPNLFPQKPFIFGEMGLGNGCSECNEVDFHNAVWATSCMQHIGAGLYFVWRNINYNYDKNFLPLKQFFSTIDFESELFTAGQTKSVQNNKAIETLYWKDQGGNKSFGWIHNESVFFSSRPGVCNLSLCDPDGPGLQTPYNITLQSSDPRVKIDQLNFLANYDIDFYETYNTGALIGSLNNETANILGQVRFKYRLNTVPDFLNNEFPDVAFKLYRNGSNREFSDTLILPNDTSVYHPEPFLFQGKLAPNHEDFSFNWDFGFGTASTEPYPAPVFPGPGSYHVKLRYEAPGAMSKWVFQTLVLLDSSGSAASGSGARMLLSSNPGGIYPNPCEDIIYINLNENASVIRIYNIVGDMLLEKLVDKGSSLNVGSFADGLYFIRIIGSGATDLYSFVKK